MMDSIEEKEEYSLDRSDIAITDTVEEHIFEEGNENMFTPLEWQKLLKKVCDENKNLHVQLSKMKEDKRRLEQNIDNLQEILN